MSSLETKSHDYQNTDQQQLDTVRVVLGSLGIGALVEVLLQIQPAINNPEQYQTFGSILSAIDPLLVLLNSWFYGLLLFPVLWLVAWWYLADLPLPSQLTDRDYVRPIRITAVLVIPFGLVSFGATAGTLTDTLEPALLSLFENVPDVGLLLVAQILVLLITCQFALGIFIWLDYRHLQKKNKFDLEAPSYEILACFISYQAFGLPALWGVRRYLGKRHLLEIGTDMEGDER